LKAFLRTREPGPIAGPELRSIGGLVAPADESGTSMTQPGAIPPTHGIGFERRRAANDGQTNGSRRPGSSRRTPGLPKARGNAPPPVDPTTIRVLIADDHPILLEGLASLIDRQPDMEVVAQAKDGREALNLYIQMSPDIGVIDLRMPEMDGIEVIAAIRAADPTARLVVLTSFAIDEDIYRALRAGARGYLLKGVTGDDLVECLRTVSEGRTCIPPAIAAKLAERVGTVELTAREREVLALIAQGKANREIGSTLDVTEGTVKVHVNNILTKLGVASRTEAVTIGVRRGLVRIEE
jgi:DNA-binding NarL/FixJ family response regulator